MNTLLRRRSMIAAGGGSPTPPAVMIPYIRGGADGSYIDTGIKPNATTKVIVWARNFNPNGGILFGSRVASGNNAFYLVANSGVNSCRMSVNYGADTKYATAGTSEIYMSNYHKYEMDGANLYIDDSLVATSTGTFSENNLNIHILGVNSNGTHNSKTSPTDICACKIYKNDVLVRDYTPVSSPSVGFYDAVSDTVFTNAGSGTMTYGEFDENAYTPLEYVECASTSYFSTGIMGSYSLPIVVKFQPRGTATGFRSVIGSRTSSSSTMCYLQIGNATYIDKVFSFWYGSVERVLYNNASLTGEKLVFVKNNNVATLYKDNSSLGTTTADLDSSFVTTYPMYIGAMNNAGGAANGFRGYLYCAGLGASANFVPAKKEGKVGMYDTYNDIFKESDSQNPFVAGPEL